MGDTDRARLAQALRDAFARIQPAEAPKRAEPAPVATTATPSALERPIGFSAELLAAILAGRKTQTRRPMRPQPTRDQPTPPPIVAGDRLWVREAWSRRPSGGFAYARDAGSTSLRMTPARFMPRDAARVFLRVTRVDQARLHAIDEADAIAEGFAASPLGNISARQAFLATWDSFYGDAEFAVARDPLVWILHFSLEDA